MKYEDYKTIDISIDAHVATVSLNLPETGNAFDGVMHEELTDALYRVNGDGSVRAIILTGAGDNFCSGGDPEYIRQITPKDYNEVFLTVRRLIQNLVSLDRPIIAAVNGDAIGVGATIAVYCDIIIAADDGVIADPHVSFGLAAGDGGAIMWAWQLGMPRAKYHLLTGEPIPMITAAQLGLINEAIPRGDVLARAQALARQLADGPGPAIRGTKRVFNKIIDAVGAVVVEFAAEQERLSICSEDHKEAVRAHFEGRQPTFVDY